MSTSDVEKSKSDVEKSTTSDVEKSTSDVEKSTSDDNSADLTNIKSEKETEEYWKLLDQIQVNINKYQAEKATQGIKQ
jgi:hypothetical protein